MNINVPDMGESVVNVLVARWLKQEGDPVKAGEAIVELETDKANLEVSAERSGVLTHITYHEGDEVHVGDALGVIEETATPQTIAAPSAVLPTAASALPIDQPAKKTDRDEEKASPIARRLADEQGVELTHVPGTGPRGRVVKRDVQRFIEQQTPAAPPTAVPASAASVIERREERVRLSLRRRTIARRLVEAQHTAAMLSTFNEIDMSAVMEVRQRRRDTFKQQYGVGLGITSFFVKAVIGALKEFPRLNAELQGDDLIVKHYYDIGVAVGASEGLVVPVLREADRLSFPAIERAIKDFASKAEANTLTLEDLHGGTFSITNGGVFGSLLSTPILNPPQVGILGLHKIEERPVVRNGEIVIRPMMYVALTYDHRVVDGREAVQFLVRAKELIEDPERLLLEG
jgi:2-oxoglutarate dehydrogenase E2 component (dihydrolipoamide succinyltransferase)